MSLTIPENRALLRSIAIPSPAPFGRMCTVQVLEDGAQFTSCTFRSGALRTSTVTGVDGQRLSAREVRAVQPTLAAIDLEPVKEIEAFEQSRTLVTQFTSDGGTGDIAIDMGNTPFNGNIISVQVEVSETLVGTAALAVRSENGQSIFQGTGLTEAGILDLEPDFVAVGLFADPLFVPVSNVPVIAGEGITLVMRLAGTVIAGAVRAFVSVTLQGVGEDLSKQILLRASVPAPSPSAAVAGSPGAAPVPGVPVIVTGRVGGLVRFPNWVSIGAQLISGRGVPGEGVTQFTLAPAINSEWEVRVGGGVGSATHLGVRQSLTGVLFKRGFGADLGSALAQASGVTECRQFLLGDASVFRRLPESIEVEIISDPLEINIFSAGGVPSRFVGEFGTRVACPVDAGRPDLSQPPPRTISPTAPFPFVRREPTTFVPFIERAVQPGAGIVVAPTRVGLPSRV